VPTLRWRPNAKTPVLVVVLALTSCGFLWEKKVVFSAPSLREEVLIEQPFPANGWGLQIVLQNSRTTKVLYQIRGDVFLNFADVSWSSKGDLIGIFTCGTPALRIAYDRGNAMEVDFAKAEPLVAAHIRAQFLSNRAKLSEPEILEWACSPEGREAFLQAHRDAKPR
jgi:hypothetical protein